MQIQDLTTSKVIDSAVLPALRGGLKAGRMADFLAEVDWARKENADPAVVVLLGRLEAWATEFAERDIDARTYRLNLLNLLPEAERGKRLVPGDGARTVDAPEKPAGRSVA